MFGLPAGEGGERVAMEKQCFGLPAGEGGEGVAMEMQCFKDAKVSERSVVNDVDVVDGQIQSIVHPRETSECTYSGEKFRDYTYSKDVRLETLRN